tara:strand:+ start:229 stop:387 length:159 start_codon:yes stop_codon:yes gene_type:complete
MDNIDIGKLKVKSHKDGEAYTLKQLLERIEILEDKQSDISYFLENPRSLNRY